MTKSRDSLGGQNNCRRASGARSSRALSTIFKRLRVLDRKIGEIDYQIKIYGFFWAKAMNPKLISKRDKLDDLRKNTRLQRKRYEAKKE